jgi:ubiquinone/menaquinone biosynthesis C-methylase UbiE
MTGTVPEGVDMVISSELEHGKFTKLAADYRHRPGYSEQVLRTILAVQRESNQVAHIADIGAGTGKLTKHLVELGTGTVIAVEPDDAMRSEGIAFTQGLDVQWRKGAGEETTLPSNSVDWLLMGSSFHWVNLEKGLTEFHRVLRPGGMFTAVWNPRDLERSPLQSKIDAQVKEMVPNLKRVSSGASSSTKDWYSLLPSTGQFRDCIFIEAKHEEVMSPERYMGVWNSVNDIQVQAGPECWQQILEMIRKEIAGLEEIVVPYSTRSWTVWRVD